VQLDFRARMHPAISSDSPYLHEVSWFGVAGWMIVLPAESFLWLK